MAAGIWGVNLDGGVAEQVGELHGEHMEGGFRRVVADQLDGGGRVSGIAVLCKGAKAAGNIHNARGGSFDGTYRCP